MKFAIVFAALCAVAFAAPPQHGVEIKKFESDVGPESFNYYFETSDGTNSQAQGQLYNIGSETETLKVSGSYQFVADDGKLYSIKYVADENGFQPLGEHLPVAPHA